MKMGLKKYVQLFLLMLLVCLSGFAQAIPVVTLTTPNPLVLAPLDSTVKATYTITNTSDTALTGVRFIPPSLTTLDSTGTTCGSSLAIDAVCSVRLNVGPSSSSGLFELNPLVLCAFGGLLCTSAPNSQRISVDFGASGTAYVSNLSDNSVSLINTETNAITDTITDVNPNPKGLALTPDLSRLYVGMQAGAEVDVIDTSTNTIIATISLPVNSSPRAVAISPDGTRAYVVSLTTNSLSVINTATNTVITNITVGTNPTDLAINPAGTRVYVINSGSNNVSVINTATNTVISTFGVGIQPQDIIITPDGATLYVTNFFDNTVTVYNSSGVLQDTISFPGAGPDKLAISDDGTRVYLSNFTNDTLSVINTADNTVITSIAVGTNPLGVAVRPDGARVYVANTASGDVSVIDTSTNTVIATVDTPGINPQRIAVSG